MSEIGSLSRLQLKVERLERNVLGGDQDFAGESGFSRAAAQSFFGGEAHEVGIVVFLGDVREDEIARARIEAFGIGKELTDRVIGKMPGAGKYALLDDPGVRANLEHVEIVVGFEDQTVGFAQMQLDMIRHVTKIGADGHLGAVGAEGEADGIGGIVREREGVNFDIADGKALAGLDGLDTIEALAKGVRKNAPERAQGRLGDIQRGFPEAQGLREAAAVVGVFVGDQDAIEAVEISFDGGKTRQRLALAQAGVHEEAGAFGFEQRDVARTAGRENGNAQADGDSPRGTKAEKRNSKNETRSAKLGR